MKERYVAKASVFFAVIGLTLMYGSSLYIQPDKVDIGEIEKSWTGRSLTIEGKIVDYSESSGHIFMDVRDDSGKIKVVKFDAEKSFGKGEEVLVEGNVDIYQGNLQIVADEIKKRA